MLPAQGVTGGAVGFRTVGYARRTVSVVVISPSALTNRLLVLRRKSVAAVRIVQFRTVQYKYLRLLV